MSDYNVLYCNDHEVTCHRHHHAYHYPDHDVLGHHDHYYHDHDYNVTEHDVCNHLDHTIINQK